MQITGFHTDGGFAEKALLPRTSLIPVPGSLSSPIACFAEPVGCVINALEKLPSPPGGRILIYGGGAMGLISGLYARHLGLIPLIIEKNETKIRKIEPFLRAADIPCVENTHESEFDGVINACADYTAFSQGISKIGKGGHLIFFSGISRNEQIDSSLLNLIHYKEAVVAGSYGLTRAHMHKAVPFMKTRAAMLELLIEEILDPENAPALMAKVLSGNYLKYILDFRKRSQAAF
jgi:nicotinate-nucleotide--dimethylbenzimidazole phosphoribosyltransferase